MDVRPVAFHLLQNMTINFGPFLKEIETRAILMDRNNHKLGLNTHGYDNTSPYSGYYPGSFKNMNTIFWAQGPSFKKNHSHRWIKMVDLYQVMIFSLG